MGYVDIRNSKLTTIKEQLTKKAAENALEKISAPSSIPELPVLPSIGANGTNPPLPVIQPCEIDLSALISALPSLPSFPSIDFPHINLPSISLPDLGINPKIPTINDFLKMLPPSLIESVKNMIPPLTPEQIIALAQLYLPPLPSLPPLSAIPGVTALKELCNPPVKAPDVSVLPPPGEPSKMDEKGINLKAQVAILGESDRQKRVPEWVNSIVADLANITLLGTSIDTLRTQLAKLADPNQNPTSELEWKTEFDSTLTMSNSVLTIFSARINFIVSLYVSCLDPNEPIVQGKALFQYSPLPHLAQHAASFKGMYNEINKYQSMFSLFQNNLIQNIQYVIDKVGYACWKLNGTEKAVYNLFNILYTDSLTILEQKFVSPYENYNITGDKFNVFSKALEANWKVNIDKLQKSLPAKG
jgi:hypothetical protein